MLVKESISLYADLSHNILSTSHTFLHGQLSTFCFTSSMFIIKMYTGISLYLKLVAFIKNWLK